METVIISSSGKVAGQDPQDRKEVIRIVSIMCVCVCVCEDKTKKNEEGDATENVWHLMFTEILTY